MPSEHLQDMCQNGYTVLERVLDLESTAELKAQIARVRAERFSHVASQDGHFWMMDMLKETSALARAVTHPVAMWILQQYLGTSEIHFCHQPIVNTLRPASKNRPGETAGGPGQNYWHTDYPYHSGRIPRRAWMDTVKLGVQYNICVDEFRSDNGATQFIPGSHLKNASPPSELNDNGVASQWGAVQFTAPPGAAIMYDAKTWHRQCPELNRSGKDRIAILNAVSPAWVVPMLSKSVEASRYAKSSVPAELNPRDRRVLERMCCAPTSAGPDIVSGAPGAPDSHFGRIRPTVRSSRDCSEWFSS
eukprot:gnl/TRDRNA2_/TRDRNA2_150081_c1_seq1.p1 gnl/TRDRNA2_/TRDRNA2_150081_c1~~gnl/TRDRNA2_/TRDRNA2_150081_c1_seq1.p1  ORF type:complete len:349 (-),score=25.84 gnl/TRDRNA2_/TRDRNA2_150081_c1_seq1:77-988(-)